MEELHASLSKQIDISSCDKLRRLDTKLSHEQVRFMSTKLGGFILFQNNLKFQEMTETFDAIEVHASSAKKIQGSVLHNSTDLPVREAQGLAQAFRISGWRANVERFRGALFICSPIEDELTFRGRESPKFQAAGLAAKERIVLGDLSRAFGCQRGDFACKCSNALDAGFDFDVARHRCFTFD
jgi:hypothetical protein